MTARRIRLRVTGRRRDPDGPPPGGGRVARYLLIESGGPWESGTTAGFYRLAQDLAGQGHEVTGYLVQNGVLAPRAGAPEVGLADVAPHARVFPGDFSLPQRGNAVPDRRPATLPPG